jgi:hypothetical protein
MTWPQNATVKLEWNCGAGDDRTTGWAARDEKGRLISIYSRTPLAPDSWLVVDERPQAATI